MVKRRRKRKKVDRVVLLTDEFIDEVMSKAAATIKEVEESLRPCFTISPSTRNLIIR